MTAALETLRKRILFRSLRRGTKESDLVLGGFARDVLSDLNEEQLVRLEALLERPDLDVLGWVVGMEPVPEAYDTDVMAMLKAYKRAL